jgi:hypothetical protein
MRTGATEARRAHPHDRIELRFKDGRGGSCIGEAAENGMRDL